MKTLLRLLLVPCSFSFTAFSLTMLDTTSARIDSAKKTDDKKWDVAAPHGPSEQIEFDTDEGTWISLDVSPDGKSVVFDLLGDIYLIPITGGTASLLSGGSPWEVQPRFSPNGKKISFTSDREGGDNIWVMDVDGKNRRAVTKEKERLLNNAIWAPDGQYLVARKHYRNTRSLGAGEMWLYHISGGDGLQLTKRRNWEQDAGEPCLSPDGKYLYYSEDVSAGPGFQYNRDPYDVIYAIKKLNLEDGKIDVIANGAGGSVRPQISPDGKTLAFVRRVRLNTVLYLQDLESGKEWALYDQLNRDAQETWAIFGVHPGFAWTPDGKFIVISAKGKIWKINVATKEAAQIPFSVHVKQTITEALRFPHEVAPDSFTVKMLRWVIVAPDRKSVVYQALGHLYIRPLPDGKLQRLTDDDTNFEMSPAYSSDGKWIAYTTWNDQAKGAVWKIQANGKKATKLVELPGHYTEPSFSSDGKRIVYRRTGGDMLRGQTYTRETGIYWIPAEGGKPTLVTREGFRPLFTKSGERIFLNSYEGEKFALISFDINGGNKLVHFTSENATQIVPSGDGKWIAFVERFNAYIAPFPVTGQSVAISPTTKDIPLRRVTRDAGMYLHWSADNKTLFWSLGPELFSRDLTNTFQFVEGAGDSVQEKPDTAGLFIGFTEKTDVPKGRLALVGATVITMRGDDVIENAAILIENDRIKTIGPSSSVTIPPGTTVVDAKEKFIMPGIIDVHAHISQGGGGVIPQQNWELFANLAYGVTTAHDPSNNTEMVFAASELQKKHLITAPRIFSTGTILYGAEGSFKAVINNLDDALSHLRRLKAVGAFSVKSYNQPRRDQRQQVIEAARQLQMMVVPEGGSMYYANMTMVLDGHTGIEHSIPVSPLYNDALTLLSKSKTGYTPTLIVSYGGLWGENYWYMKTNVWENERLLKYTPREIIDSRSRRRMMAAEDDWNFVENAVAAKRAYDLGTKIQLGAHGQLQGLGAHWEMWMFVQGGMTPLQAMRCATLYGAQYIGLDKDLGSLEEGKLADLIVMDRNPLQNIQNSNSVRYVMLNGRLYDASTMNEIGNYSVTRKPFYFEGGMSAGGTATGDEEGWMED